MKRWTPEAEQRLDNYLEEIVNLARSSGEADEDFVEELRQHIRSDAEESAGGVVTPQNLERALAAAGKPRDVLGMETESPGNGNGHRPLRRAVRFLDGCSGGESAAPERHGSVGFTLRTSACLVNLRPAGAEALCILTRELRGFGQQHTRITGRCPLEL
jgi:plasmid stabilization system protein ParE